MPSTNLWGDAPSPNQDDDGPLDDDESYQLIELVDGPVGRESREGRNAMDTPRERERLVASGMGVAGVGEYGNAIRIV